MATPRLRFALFCIASYLLSLSYGATFVLSLLVKSFGGNEQDAGRVISIAMISTITAVLGSGHLTDHWGAARTVALGALCLMLASLGFALVPGLGVALFVCGLMLGLGWGIFYTLGPIMVVGMVEPQRRTHCFALLSGSMMMGLGSAPLIGKLASMAGLPVQATFVCATIAALIGGSYFAWLGTQPTTSTAGTARLTAAAGARVLASRSVFSILTVGLSGAIFGVMGSFQTSYAKSLGLDYSLYFIGFMGAAISCRLVIASWVVKREPYLASSVLTGLMLLAIIGFAGWVHDSLSYLLAAAMLGVGYGLNYSVINGLAANEAPAGHTPQALLLFSLSYCLGVFGFPLLAGHLIVDSGMHGMLIAMGVLAVLIWVVALGRLTVSRLRPTPRAVP